jgi:hypothetical protein
MTQFSAGGLSVWPPTTAFFPTLRIGSGRWRRRTSSAERAPAVLTVIGDIQRSTSKSSK